MTWKEAFWSLFHLVKEILLLLEAKDKSDGRRKYDGYLTSVREKLDNIVLNAPKENENGEIKGIADILNSGCGGDTGSD